MKLKKSHQKMLFEKYQGIESGKCKTFDMQNLDRPGFCMFRYPV